MNKKGLAFEIGVIIFIIIIVGSGIYVDNITKEKQELRSNTCYLKCGEGFKDSYRAGDYPYLRCIKLENKILKECYIDYPKKEAQNA